MNLDEIALKVADETRNLKIMLNPEVIQDFAHRIVAELAKQEPVFEVGFGWLDTVNIYPNGTKFYAAPVIPAGWVMVKADILFLLGVAGIDHIDREDWAKVKVLMDKYEYKL
jgi:hypothetical protein